MRTPDGHVWVRGTLTYSFWKRYLDVFDQVRAIARLSDSTAEPDSGWRRADGEGVTFHALPCYVGPLQYAQKFYSVWASMRNAVRPSDAVIMRVPSPIAHLLDRQLARARPFGLEVIGNPNDIFAPGSMEHPLRAFFRSLSIHQLKLQCRKACAVAYVTGILERDYPPAKNAFSTAYSSIDLDDSAFATNPRSFVAFSGTRRVISVGTLEVLYKGFDILIDALSACVQAGLELELVIVGDGRCRPELERRTQLRGIERRVAFTGWLPGGQLVRNELDQADLFVLASKTEGLPRAMIEAMARSLPCVGSAVGGIPELLSPENLVRCGDAPGLARKITEVINDPGRMTRMSAANLARAHEYHASVINPRRHQFYSYLLEATREWNESHLRTAPKPAPARKDLADGKIAGEERPVDQMQNTSRRPGTQSQNG
jgi:glycosyltransferase involved in cell wall biosynthesis